MNTLKKTLLAASLFAIAGVANAMPITGTITFSGNVTPTNGTSILDATTFTFGNPVTVGGADPIFAPLLTTGVHYSNLDLDSLPATPLWSQTVSTTTYSYDLSNITLDTTIGGSRILNGSGIMSVTGLTDTDYLWRFSSQSGATSGKFTFSASNVPEPAVALLLGAGLIGFGVARKAKARKTA